jgi:hypothetical protein
LTAEGKSFIASGRIAITRVIRETSEAFADYMDANFRDLPCLRIELDEQWQYVGCHEGYSYGTETKIFGEPQLPDGTLARLGRNEGVRKMQTAERKAVVGSPDLESLTTSHVERLFLSVRQELKRFQRKGLGYSKDLGTHKRHCLIDKR